MRKFPVIFVPTKFVFGSFLIINSVSFTGARSCSSCRVWAWPAVFCTGVCLEAQRGQQRLSRGTLAFTSVGLVIRRRNLVQVDYNDLRNHG